jgi:hypothetical protein
MGSVQELSNGNMLIGWGSTPTGLVATEVDRNGSVQAEITTQIQISTPYRVRKGIIAMTASTRTLDTLGRFVFAQSDSTTRITATVTTSLTSADITVEKHNYAPHNQQFDLDPPCTIIPIRWVVRGVDTAMLKGHFQFDSSRLLGDFAIDDVDVFQRDTENDGLFRKCDAHPLEGTSLLQVNELRSGEYMIAAQHCSQPLLRVPNNNSVVGATVTMEWTEAVGADGYELEISEDPAFANEALFVRTQYNDTTLTGFAQGVTYFWRVRVVRQPEVGSWTQPWSFTIPLALSVEGQPLTNNVSQRGTILDVNQEIEPQRLDVYTLAGERILSVVHPMLVDVAHLSTGCYAVILTTISGKKYRTLIMR